MATVLAAYAIAREVGGGARARSCPRRRPFGSSPGKTGRRRLLHRDPRRRVRVRAPALSRGGAAGAPTARVRVDPRRAGRSGAHAVPRAFPRASPGPVPIKRAAAPRLPAGAALASWYPTWSRATVPPPPFGWYHARGASADERGRPVWYYAVAIAGDGQISAALRSVARPPRAPEDGARSSSLRAASFRFQHAVGKRNVYLLPIYPFVAAIVAPLLLDSGTAYGCAPRGRAAVAAPSRVPGRARERAHEIAAGRVYLVACAGGDGRARLRGRPPGTRVVAERSPPGAALIPALSPHAGPIHAGPGTWRRRWSASRRGRAARRLPHVAVEPDARRGAPPRRPRGPRRSWRRSRRAAAVADGRGGHAREPARSPSLVPRSTRPVLLTPVLLDILDRGRAPATLPGAPTDGIVAGAVRSRGLGALPSRRETSMTAPPAPRIRRPARRLAGGRDRLPRGTRAGWLRDACRPRRARSRGTFSTKRFNCPSRKGQGGEEGCPDACG